VTESEKQKQLQRLHEASSEEMYLYDPFFKDTYGGFPLKQNVRVIKRTEKQVQIVAKCETGYIARYVLRHISKSAVADDLDHLRACESIGLQLFNDKEHFDAWLHSFRTANGRTGT